MCWYLQNKTRREILPVRSSARGGLRSLKAVRCGSSLTVQWVLSGLLGLHVDEGQMLLESNDLLNKPINEGDPVVATDERGCPGEMRLELDALLCEALVGVVLSRWVRVLEIRSLHQHDMCGERAISGWRPCVSTY
jgi:hypothetical protein